MTKKPPKSYYDKLFPPPEVVQAITVEEYVLLCCIVGDDEADRLVDNARRKLKEGRPFTGPADKELDEYLSLAGIDRSRCRVTNPVKCRPPNNRTPHAFPLGIGWE